MFIERLTQDDFNKIIELFDIPVYKNCQTKGTHISKKQNEIIIKSFDHSACHFSYYDDYELTIMDFYAHFFSISKSKFDYNKTTLITYYSFMYEKFGEEYLEELKKYLQNQKKNKLKDFSKKIDEENNKIIEEITK